MHVCVCLCKFDCGEGDIKKMLKHSQVFALKLFYLSLHISRQASLCRTFIVWETGEKLSSSDYWWVLGWSPNETVIFCGCGDGLLPNAGFKARSFFKSDITSILIFVLKFPPNAYFGKLEKMADVSTLSIWSDIIWIINEPNVLRCLLKIR